MSRKRTSIIWQLPDINFINLIKNSKTMSEVLRYFGLENKGGNYQACKKRIEELKLDTSHFLCRIDSCVLTRSITKDQFLLRLTKESSISRGTIKRLLIKFNLLEYKCRDCGNNGNWNNKPMSLQLEHINGISNDNRLENLCFLCPNCHSQTDTFAGKSLKKYYFCKSCGNPSKGYSKENNCQKCSSQKRQIYNRPSKEQLEGAILEMPMLQVAKKFGAKSDNTIRKWCQSYGINWQELSKFSRVNRRKKIKVGRKFPSKYLHVSKDNTRNKWMVHIKNNNIHKRFDTELEAAQFVASNFNSESLILRKTNI